MYSQRIARWHLASLITAVSIVLLSSCTGGSSDSSGGSGSSGGGGGGGSGDPAAVKAVQAYLDSIWFKNKDGWTAEMAEQIPLNPPVRVLKQFRELKFTVAAEPVTEANKLNGVEWMGTIEFEQTARRYWREEADVENPKGWSIWRQDTPVYQLFVYKKGGQWKVDDTGFMPMSDWHKPADIPE